MQVGVAVVVVVVVALRQLLDGFHGGARAFIEYFLEPKRESRHERGGVGHSGPFPIGLPVKFNFGMDRRM